MPCIVLPLNELVRGCSGFGKAGGPYLGNRFWLKSKKEVRLDEVGHLRWRGGVEVAKRMLLRVASRLGLTPRGLAGYYQWN